MTKPAKIAVGRIGRPKLGSDGRTMVVSIPISFRRQGGRKTVVTPSHAPAWSLPLPKHLGAVKPELRNRRCFVRVIDENNKELYRAPLNPRL